MRHYRALSFSAIAAVVFAVTGCSDTAGVTEKTKITSPTGTTVITKDSKVESSGSNPPIPVEGGTNSTTTTTTTKP